MFENDASNTPSVILKGNRQIGLELFTKPWQIRYGG